MDLMSGKTKEVDEWLMGSGESADTAISQGLKNQPSFRIIDSRTGGTADKQRSNNVAGRPERKEPEEEDQEENWMFKTFKKETVIIPAASNTAVSPDLKKQNTEMNIQENQDEDKGGQDPFTGLDDFIMSKRIEPAYQNQ